MSLVLVPSAGIATSLLLIGDSITNSQVSGPPGPGYPEQLAELLGPDYEVIAAGLSGSSAFLWDPDFAACAIFCTETPELSFYEWQAEEHVESAIVSILLGTNDAIGFLLEQSTDPGAYRLLLEGLIDRIVADGPSEVILMAPPLTPTLTVANTLLTAYHTQILDLCAARDVITCGPDLFELLDPQLDFAGSDIHPTVAGHGKIAEALAETVLGIPEPSTGLLLGMGMAAVSARARRRRYGRG
jgi:lysophospholipase L1-like esterase